MLIPAFPKILQLGAREAEHLFDGSVEITEKIDGSQFTFGIVDGHFYARSKGSVIAEGNNMDIPSLFSNSVPLLDDFKKLIPDLPTKNILFSGEFLNSAKHNILQYGSVPKRHFAAFAVGEKVENAWRYSSPYSDTIGRSILFSLGVDRVPVLHHGDLRPTKEFFDKLLDTESFLGKEKIEGFVIKNYNQSFMIGSQYMPILSCKYVSERFKERHHKDWVPGEDIVTKIVNKLTSPARYDKAIQKMREEGTHTGTLKDIGPLMGLVAKDFREEEENEIKEMLFKYYWKSISNKVIRGLPEWYKRQLLDQTIRTAESGEYDIREIGRTSDAVSES